MADRIRHKPASERQLHPKTMKQELGWEKPKGVPSYDSLVDAGFVLYWKNRKAA